MTIKYGPLDHEQVWVHYAEGQLPVEIGRSMGRPPDAIYALIYKAGGIKPAARGRSPRQLSLVEREEISRGLAAVSRAERLPPRWVRRRRRLAAR